MPGWTDEQVLIKYGLRSEDLGSCASPPTITIEKVVDEQRVKPGDQFQLTLEQEDTLIGEATTQGSKNGVQDQKIGPFPTTYGATLTFSESAAGTTRLSDYGTDYQCSVDGNVISGGSGTTGSITIPHGASVVECQLTNWPRKPEAQVTIHKTVVDKDGRNPQPGRQWTVGATARATTGSASLTPRASQRTNTRGDASWTVEFGGVNDRATVTVSETQQDGYEFVRQDSQCVITQENGSSRTIQLTSERGQALRGIAPGDSIECTYVNKVQAPPQTLTLIKDVHNEYGGTRVPADWNGRLHATKDGTTLRFDSGETLEVEAGEWKIGEDNLPGYLRTGLSCVNGVYSIFTQTVTVREGVDVTCTITNHDRDGLIAWDKVDKVTGEFLPGSEWVISGPRFETTQLIKDCTQWPCQGLDLTQDEGSFFIDQLPWGKYTITEVKAPPGYVLSEPANSFTIIIDAENAGVVQIPEGSPFTNVRPDGPELPSTGGIGRDQIVLAGAFLLLLALLGYGAVRFRNRGHRDIA